MAPEQKAKQLAKIPRDQGIFQLILFVPAQHVHHLPHHPTHNFQVTHLAHSIRQHSRGSNGGGEVGVRRGGGLEQELQQGDGLLRVLILPGEGVDVAWQHQHESQQFCEDGFVVGLDEG